jgi:2-polyprenyl-3-methyl-5-hydroxy-6-metoxy-1,4-benzoquinol methylase
MRTEVIQQLLALNQDFYTRLAEPFAQSRQRPQPGFYRLIEELPQPCTHLLDVGCGDGRLGRFLVARRAIRWYTGVDFSDELLALAQAITMGDFHQRDLSQPGCLYGLGHYDVITCLATLQHIPGQANRLNLLQEMKAHLAPGGRIILSNWQFGGSKRQRRKVVDWSAVNLSLTDVEPNDYLLTWQRKGFSFRYVAIIDEAVTAELARQAELRVQAHFHSDGQEGNLSLYTILEALA